MNTYQEKEQRIRDLQAMLSCTSSPIGDWKVAKCIEYQLSGLEPPYDVNELHTQRQAVRDEINKIQEELETLSLEEEMVD